MREFGCELPSEDERHEADCEADQSGAPAADPLRHPAEDRPEERSAEQRDSGQESFLRGRELQRFADEWSERSEDHPDHEADVEIQERGCQCGRVPGLSKIAE